MIFNFQELRKHFIIRRPLQLLLVAALVLAAYYPVAFGELCFIDDLKMVSTYSGVKSLDLKGVFAPGWNHGVYYRPVMMLSYIFDNFLFQLDAGFLHIENIVLHIINACLVFLLVWQIVPPETGRKSFAPLAASLIFGLHPVNTESVSWISGRTDVLACTFVLLSSNFLLIYKRKHTHWFLLAAGISLLFGFLTKETTLAFIPGFFLIMRANEEPFITLQSPQSTSTNAARKLVVLSTASIIAVAVFFFLRSRAILTNDTDKIGFTVTSFFLDVPDSMMVVMNAFVFYVKKLFAPFPLNFVIVEIDPLYEFLGLPLIMLSLYILGRKNLISGLFISGVFLIMPAFVLAFNQIAWVPYAERYVYIASAFIMPASVLFLDEIRTRMPSLRPWIVAVTSIVIFIMPIAVFQRSLIWKSNLTLFQDTVGKNPTEFMPRVCYGFALVDHGQLEKARDQFLRANKENRARIVIKKSGVNNDENPDMIEAPFYQNRFGYWEDADLGLAYILEKEGKIAEAITGYERICDKMGGQPTDARKRLVNLYAEKLSKVKNKTEVSSLKKKLHRYTDKWQGTDRAEILYRIGRNLSALGDKEGALIFIKKAHSACSDADEYKPIFAKLIQNMENESI